MTKSGLPEITLTCGNDHEFTTKASGGQSVRCKTCHRSTHVPTDRPKTTREAAAYATAAAEHGQEHAPGSEYGDRWQLETEWSGKEVVRPGRPRDTCPECSGPLWWEPRRTLIFCQNCNRLTLPPVITDHYGRAASQRSAVAVRDQADPMAEMAARARLRALIATTEQWANGWIETLGDEDSYDRVQWKRSAREFTATLGGWLAEIKNAKTESELADIKAHIVGEILNSEPGTQLRAEYDEALGRSEQAELRRQRAEEVAAAEARAEAERVNWEPEPEQLPAARPPAITSGYSPPHSWGTVAGALIAAQQRKERQLRENGGCEFKHRLTTVAGRIYGVPERNYLNEQTGNAAIGTPQFRACPKHFSAAEAELNRQGYSDLVWWDLSGN